MSWKITPNGAAQKIGSTSMYAQGHGVTQDYKTAFKWFELAAEQGHAGAQYNLGIMYEKGFGVAQDFARVYMWWDIAASKGNELAADGRTELQEVFSPAQIEEAQKLARECLAKNYKKC